MKTLSKQSIVCIESQGRRGKGGDTWRADGLVGELAALGLRVKEMPSDGNCFFFAICDQLEVRRYYQPVSKSL